MQTYLTFAGGMLLVCLLIPMLGLTSTVEDGAVSPTTDPGNTGVVPWDTPVDLTLSWEISTQASISRTPAWTDEFIISGSDDGIILCSNITDGAEVWSYETGSTIVGDIIITPDGRKVVTTTAGGTVIIIEIADGNGGGIELGSPTSAGATVTDGSVFVGDQSGSFHRFSLGGAQQWVYPERVAPIMDQIIPPPTSILTRPGVSDGEVYFGDDSGNVYSLDETTGELRWWSEVGGAIRAAPTIEGELVYIGSDDGTITAFSRDIPGSFRPDQAVEGVMEWSADVGAAVHASPGVVDGSVFYTTRSGSVGRLDRSGNHLWEHDSIHGISGIPRVTRDGFVYANDAGMVVVRSHGGVVMNELETGHLDLGSVAVLENGIAVGSDDGTLILLSSSTGFGDLGQGSGETNVDPRAEMTALGLTVVGFIIYFAWLYMRKKGNGELEKFLTIGQDQLQRDHYMVVVAGSLSKLMMFMLNVPLAFYMSQHAGPFEVGLVFSLPALALGLGNYLWGAVSDLRRNRKDIIIYTHVGAALLYFILPLFEPMGIILVRTLQISLIASAQPLVTTMVTEYQPGRKGEAIVSYLFWDAIFGALGLFFGGYLYRMGGLGYPSIVSVVLTVLTIALLYRVRDSFNFTGAHKVIEHDDGPRTSISTRVREYFNLTHIRIIGMVFLSLLVLNLGSGIYNALTPGYLDNEGFDIAMFGIYALTMALPAVIMLPFLGRISDKRSGRVVFFWALILYIFLWGGFTFSAHTGFSLDLQALIYLWPVYPFMYTGSQAFISEITHEEERGRGLGLVLGSIQFGFVMGIVGGWLAGIYGYLFTFDVALIFIFLAVVLGVLTIRMAKDIRIKD